MTKIIQDEELFHINRKLPYSNFNTLMPGQNIATGETYNPFFNFYQGIRQYPVKQNNGDIINLPAIKFLSGVKKGEIKPEYFPDVAYEIANHFLMLSRELIFEDVRFKFCNDAPSRHRCIWLLKAKEDADFWWNRLSCGEESQILKIKATGKSHVADAGLLLGDSEPLAQTYAKAEKYWKGEFSDHPEMEIIFEGKLEVIETLKPPN